MEKYAVLLAGENNTIKNDFFNQMDDVFTTVSTSMRRDDILNHLAFFSPDIFVYCLGDQKRDDWSRVAEFKERLKAEETVMVIVGSWESCEYFQRVADRMADLVLHKPITASAIRERIVSYMKALARKKEEKRQQEEAIALKEEIKRQREEALAQERDEEEKRQQEEAVARKEKMKWQRREETPAQEQKEERRKHVLVIDDDPLMLKLIKEHLHERYDVATAISGRIAYKFLESKKTDLILLDYEMPGENGPAVLARIRENAELAEIPVIFLTGVTERGKITQALQLNPQGYLLKPIERNNLLAIIEKYIG